MCNINIFIQSEQKKSTEELNGFLSFFDCALNNSFLHNSDGEGFYFDADNVLIKNDNKINILNYADLVQRSKFIITHQRLSTSGKKTEYHHPFMNDDFVLVHNGVMNDFKEGMENKEDISDTYAFFMRFNEEFSKIGTFTFKSRMERVIKTIQTLLDGAGGWFSIAIYDIKDKILYYFKDDYTRIALYRSLDKNELYLTTEKDNRVFLELYKKSFKEIELKPFVIHAISINNKNKIVLNTNAGDIKKKTTFKLKKNKKGKNKKPSLSGYGGGSYYDYYRYGDYGYHSFEDAPIKINASDTQTKLFNGYFSYSKLNSNGATCNVCKKSKADYFDSLLGYSCEDCFNKEYEGI